jgi:hypothetical protein
MLRSTIAISQPPFCRRERYVRSDPPPARRNPGEFPRNPIECGDIAHLALRSSHDRYDVNIRNSSLIIGFFLALT